MSYKIAIYTAVFGGKDEVREPIGYKANSTIDYFLITDDEHLKSESYKIIHKKPVYNDITKNARYYKILGLDEFKNYDYVIWYDANLQVIHHEIIKLINRAEHSPIAFFKHPDRNCIYEEAIKCIHLDKDYPIKIFKQIFGYYIYGVKNETGLYETTIIVKNNKIISKEFLEFWWKEIKYKSRRDQLSLPYALSKFDIKPAILNGCRDQNEYSIFYKHNYEYYGFLSRKEHNQHNSFIKRVVLKLIRILKNNNR